MTDYTWPDDLPPFGMTFYLQPHVGRSESPFTRQQKTYGLSAPRWKARMAFRGGYDGTTGAGAFGPRMDAFLVKLRGGQNRVSVYDFRRSEVRASGWSVSVVNDEAEAGATEITLQGGEPGACLMMDGDYIGGDGRPHIVIGDAYADSTGAAVVTFDPPLVDYIAAGSAIYGKVPGWFRLVDDDAGANPTEVGGPVGYEFELAEDLNGFDTSSATMDQVKNWFDKDHIVSGAARTVVRDKLYNNDGSTSATIPAGTSGHAFILLGDFPVVVGKAGTLSLAPGPANWAFNAARVNFHSASPPTSGNLVSSVTSGITLSADLQTIKWSAAAVPVGAVCATTNIKYGQGISLGYASTNEIPTGAETALLPYVMLNYATDAACLTPYGATGTTETITAEPDLDEGEFIVNRHGQKLLLRFQGLAPAGYDMTFRELTADANHDYNNAFQFVSKAEIVNTTPAPSTPGAFQNEYSPTGADDQSFAIENDNFPAYRMTGIGDTSDGQYAGGNHGIVSFQLTAAAHGKTNAEILGTRWTKDGKVSVVTQVPTTGLITMTYPFTGGDSDWVGDATTPTSGTWTHVSGATDTADIVASAVAQAQLYPALKNVVRTLRFDGNSELTESGVYRTRFLRRTISYDICIPPQVIAYVEANKLATDGLNYNDPSIGSQVQMHVDYLTDGYAATGVHLRAEVVKAHHRVYLIGQQWQPINRRGTETLRLFVEGAIPFESGPTQSGGNLLDFGAATGANVTSNASEYYFDESTWAAGSTWKDGVQRQPTLWMQGAMDAGGSWRRIWVMVQDLAVGRTALPGGTDLAAIYSAANKLYLYGDHDRDVADGEVDMVAGGFGVQAVGFDPEALVNFAYPRTTSEYGMRWHRTNTTPLTNYLIPVRPNLVGKRIRIDAEMTTVTVHDSVVGANGIRVSTTGAGGVALTLY